jgi:hypothetical protein
MFPARRKGASVSDMRGGVTVGHGLPDAVIGSLDSERNMEETRVEVDAIVNEEN